MRPSLPLVLLALACTASLHADHFTAKERQQRYSDRVILAKPRAHHRTTIDASEAREHVRVRDKFTRLGDLRVVHVEAGETVDEAIARLQATGRYDFVERDYIELPDATPNDASFPQQWALQNTGQLPGSVAGADIKAVPAWDIIREAPNVVVAVIDNGINVNHRDIAANLWRNPAPTFGDVNGAAFVRGVRSGNIADQTGHGTHVAGIIGAVGNNTFNISGIAWKVQLMALKNSDVTGASSTSDSAACVEYAVAKGAHIINCSFGGTNFSQTFITALRAARDAGVLVVTSAGNDSTNNDDAAHFPANYLLDNIVSVGNSGPADLPSTSSGFGGLVDLYAPGSSILSLDLTTTGQVTRSGTSMAAPHVTGALALLRAQFPSDNYRQLINRLLRGVDRMPAFAGRAHSGGRLNLLGALTASTSRPLNDDFATRPSIVGSGLTLRANNTGATAEPGEPSHATLPPVSTLWWQWTAPVTGAATLSTAGSSYDTVVAVYTGDRLGNLTLVASNDDANGLTTSQLSFNAQIGVTYQIAVGSKGAAAGQTVINFGTAPANDLLANATALPSLESTRALGTTVHATTQAGEPRIQGNIGGGSVWLKWTAPRSGRFQAAVYTTEFDSLLGVYTGAAADQLTLVAENDDTGVNGVNSDSVVSFQATGGTTYYFKVDNKDALTRGDFVFTLTDSTWQFATEGSQSGSPAVADDGTIYVGGGSPDPNFYAINPDGSSKWVHRAAGILSNASPAVAADGTVYFGTTDGRVTALRPDGSVRWQRAVAIGSVSVSPALGIDGTVYIHGTDTFLYALHPGTGATLWRSVVDAATFASAAVGPDGTIYQPSDANYLYALRPDGSRKWRFPIGSDTYATPAIDAGGNVYLTTFTSGTVFCISADGALRWSYLLPRSAFMFGSVTLSGDGTAAYVGATNRTLYALNTIDGSLRWRAELTDAILSSTPAVDSAGTIYVGTNDGKLHAIDGSGTLRRHWDTARPIVASPAIAGRTLYVGSGDAKLYAIDIGNGPAAGAWAQYRQSSRRQGRVASSTFALTYEPAAVSRIASQSILLAAGASGQEPLTFQWHRNGVAIPGATLATYSVNVSTISDAGVYTVTVSGPQGTLTSRPATVTLEPLVTPRIANFSVRAVPGAGAQGMMIGFNVGPGAAKPLLIRGVGPSLAAVGVTGELADPEITVLSGNTVLATNDNWGNDATVAAANARLRAFPIDGASRDAALYRTFSPGRYAVELNAVGASTGVALLELYDGDPVTSDAPGQSRLTNVSARGQVGTGNNIFIAGFAVVGNVPRNLLIRAIGPALAGFGITGGIADPVLEIYRGATLVARNDDWAGSITLGTAALLAQAFAIPSTSPRDSALVISLPAGVYTARVTGIGGATGVTLLEIYEMP